MAEHKLWDFQDNFVLYCIILGASLASFLVCLKITFGTTVKIKDLNLYGTDIKMDAFEKNSHSSESQCPMKTRRPSKVYKSGIYGYIRHPMMAFLMYSILLSPTMSVGHALWSGVMSLYIVSAVVMFEEPALIEEFGEEYKQYMEEVPGFVPNLRKILAI